MTRPSLPSARKGRSRLWATLFTVPALGVLVALGFWQLQRLEWKEALIAERAAGLAQPATDLAAAAQPEQLLPFSRVSAKGRFLAVPAIHMGPRSYNGRAGFHAHSPFQLEDGRIILVNRGFVPGQGARPLAWEDRQQGQDMAISGILRLDLARPAMAPDNLPADGTWFWHDLAGLEAHWGVKLQPLVLDLWEPAPPPHHPQPGQTRLEIVNNHLQYAATWFAFALVLLIIYGLFMRKNRG